MTYLQVLLISILLLAYNTGVAQTLTKTPNKTASNQGRYQAPFRYVIVAGVSQIEKFVNENGGPAFVVLLEDKAFTEANLVTLFEMIGRRYSTDFALSIHVYTTLEAIRTPEENDGLPLWGPIERYERFKYAFFVRNGYGERFTYGIPGRVKAKIIRMKQRNGVDSRS